MRPRSSKKLKIIYSSFFPPSRIWAGKELRKKPERSFWDIKKREILVLPCGTLEQKSNLTSKKRFNRQIVFSHRAIFCFFVHGVKIGGFTLYYSWNTLFCVRWLLAGTKTRQQDYVLPFKTTLILREGSVIWSNNLCQMPLYFVLPNDDAMTIKFQIFLH